VRTFKCVFCRQAGGTFVTRVANVDGEEMKVYIHAECEWKGNLDEYATQFKSEIEAGVKND